MKSRSEIPHEVDIKTDAQIDRETAIKWLSRAEACLRRYRETGRVDWLTRAHGHASEALEHAALALDGGRLVAQVERRIRRAAHSAGIESMIGGSLP